MPEETVLNKIIEKVGVALKLIDGHDLSSQIARQHLAEGLRLLERLNVAEVPNKPDLEFPVTVWFRRLRGDDWIKGKLGLDLTLDFKGKKYPSPSNAASDLAGNSRDGWRDIYYDDPQSGKRLPIDNFRKDGLLGAA